MTRILRSFVFVCVLSGSTMAAEPKAFMTGPATAAVGDDFFLRFKGTISDSPVVFKQAAGPVPAAIMLLTAPGGQVACAVVNGSQVGSYTFALMARGKPEPTSEEVQDFAIWTVKVGKTDPNPPPEPPEPTPIPSSGVALGAAYVPMFAQANAASWNAYADAVDAGKSLPDAKVAFKAAGDSVTHPWVDKNVDPLVAAILPENTPPTDVQRKALSAFARDVAKGSQVPQGRELLWRGIH